MPRTPQKAEADANTGYAYQETELFFLIEEQDRPSENDKQKRGSQAHPICECSHAPSGGPS